MHLATIRIGSAIVASFSYKTLDEAGGAHVSDLVKSWVRDGAGCVVVDFDPEMMMTTAGARWLLDASRALPADVSLRVSGLGPRARAMLRPLAVAGRIELYDWWSLALDARRAA